MIFSQLAWSQDFVLDEFVQELSLRQSRVEEFRHIKKIATSLGIKHVYMFGGTAAAWGHYVRWDMRRELGIENLQAGRFDYDYTNIFRANQDFDVVIDGTTEQAEALEAAVQSKFNYFSGSRPTWEVRLLNEKRLDKDPILGANFQNQHTDSHSTGLIEMMDCEGFDCVKDVRDIKNSKPAFLMDMFEAKLHYYFSDKHTQTSRYLKGMNPPILSVIRYFTKAVQYELEQRPEDIQILEKMIRDFSPRDAHNWDSYVLRWLEKNAKKLIVNAVDMEFAQNLIEKNGLKRKLKALGNPSRFDSMAWWLDKEALKSFPLGQGQGKTAAELFPSNENGEIIVAHETNSFPAFESITKSHDGKANVLISRKDKNGESAVFGSGHYTRFGRSGARGTGLTIRYKLNPMARVGSDFFIASDDYVIVNNKLALEVIYESMNLDAESFYDLLLGGLEFDFSDQGVLEKIKRRISRQILQMSASERIKILSKIKDKVHSNEIKEASLAYILSQEWVVKNRSFWRFAIERYFRDKKFLPTVGYVLTQEAVVKHARDWEIYVKRFLGNEEYRSEFLKLLIHSNELASNHREWLKYAKMFLSTDMFFSRSYFTSQVLNSEILLSRPKLWEKAAFMYMDFFQRHEVLHAVVLTEKTVQSRVSKQWKAVVKHLISQGSELDGIAISILGGDWRIHSQEDWLELVQAFIDNGERLETLASHSLSNRRVDLSPKQGIAITKAFIEKIKRDKPELLDSYQVKSVRELNLEYRLLKSSDKKSSKKQSKRLHTWLKTTCNWIFK